jgi:chromosome segregation ATPase
MDRDQLKAEFEALQQEKADLAERLDYLQKEKEQASSKLLEVRKAREETSAESSKDQQEGLVAEIFNSLGSEQQSK